MPSDLSPRVLAQLNRLKATQRAKPKKRRIFGVAPADIPEPIRSFIEDYDWPEDFEMDRPETGTVCVDFAYDPLEILRESATTFSVGITGNGWAFLAVRLEDPDPSDPTLCVIDHETQEEVVESMKLSEYLSSLVLRPKDQEPEEY